MINKEINPSDKDLIEKAAKTERRSMSSFVINSAIENANRILEDIK